MFSKIRASISHSISIVLLTAVVLFQSFSAYAVEPPASCVEIQNLGGSNGEYRITNNCTTDVSVAYCSITKKIWGKQCGQTESKFNQYYTHMMTLKPSEKSSRSGNGEMRFAACPGYINSWDSIKGKFQSNTDGSFVCWPETNLPKDKIAEKTESTKTQMAISSAASKDIGDACAHAREPLIEAGITPPLCNCKAAGAEGLTAKIYRCEIQYAIPETSGDMINSLKSWVRKQIPTYDATKEKDCAKSRSVSIGGIRG